MGIRRPRSATRLSRTLPSSRCAPWRGRREIDASRGVCRRVPSAPSAPLRPRWDQRKICWPTWGPTQSFSGMNPKSAAPPPPTKGAKRHFMSSGAAAHYNRTFARVSVPAHAPLIFEIVGDGGRQRGAAGGWRAAFAVLVNKASRTGCVGQGCYVHGVLKLSGSNVETAAQCSIGHCRNATPIREPKPWTPASGEKKWVDSDRPGRLGASSLSRPPVQATGV